MEDNKFFICKHCGNLVGMIFSSGAKIVCCGDEMTLLEANTVDASKEKHVPKIEISENTIKVKVGEILHPMLPEHHIEWIYLSTEKGGQRKKCIDTPEATFIVADDDKPVSVFAYCNLHGLWKKDI
jgi:superoxide reductase